MSGHNLNKSHLHLQSCLPGKGIGRALMSKVAQVSKAAVLSCFFSNMTVNEVDVLFLLFTLYIIRTHV